jgi:hypothetical protein
MGVMNTKNVGLVIAAFVLSLAGAPAAFACGDGECEPPPDEEPTKGNNGWGNGADSTNAGSDAGGTQGSKSSNGYGTGPGPTKFDER